MSRRPGAPLVAATVAVVLLGGCRPGSAARPAPHPGAGTAPPPAAAPPSVAPRHLPPPARPPSPGAPPGSVCPGALGCSPHPCAQLLGGGGSGVAAPAAGTVLLPARRAVAPGARCNPRPSARGRLVPIRMP